MHYLIYGAGAVGSMLGTQLALNGEHVSFLARPREAEEFNVYGITLTGIRSPGRLENPKIYTTPEDAISSTAIDVVLLTVKAYDVEASGKSIRVLLPRATPVVCLSNGVGSEKTLAGIIGGKNVIAASLTTAVRLRPRGVVHVARERGLGISGNHHALPQLLNTLKHAGIKTRSHTHSVRRK